MATHDEIQQLSNELQEYYCSDSTVVGIYQNRDTYQNEVWIMSSHKGIPVLKLRLGIMTDSVDVLRSKIDAYLAEEDARIEAYYNEHGIYEPD